MKQNAICAPSHLSRYVLLTTRRASALSDISHGRPERGKHIHVEFVMMHASHLSSSTPPPGDGGTSTWLSTIIERVHHPQYYQKMVVSSEASETVHGANTGVLRVGSGMLTSTVVLMLLPFTWLVSFVAPFALPHYLTFLPANVVLTHTYVWTLFTQAVVELDWLALVASVVGVILCLAPAEAFLGGERVFVFCAIVLVLSSLTIIVASAVLFGVLGWFWLYQTFAGFLPVAVSCAVLVVHKTQGVDFAVTWPLLSALRTKHLPFLLLVFAACRDLWSRVIFPTPSDTMSEMDIGSTDELFEAPLLPMSLTAFYVSWLLIRFWGSEWASVTSLLKPQPSAQSTSAVKKRFSRSFGDGSPSFALAEFFPYPIQSLVVVVSRVMFPFARAVGLGAGIATTASTPQNIEEGAVGDNCSSYHRLAMFSVTATNVAAPQAPRSLDGAGESATLQLAPLPGSSSADADRRRAIALAALTARLQQVVPPLEPAPPVEVEVCGSSDAGEPFPSARSTES